MRTENPPPLLLYLLLRTQKQDVLLVDHNSLSIPGLDDEVLRSRFNVVGCVDHHVDEESVPQGADPRIVTTGIGSCTSLVVSHLREQGLWPEVAGNSADDGLNQITRLALAPILIDTLSLRATKMILRSGAPRFLDLAVAGQRPVVAAAQRARGNRLRDPRRAGRPPRRPPAASSPAGRGARWPLAGGRCSRTCWGSRCMPWTCRARVSPGRGAAGAQRRRPDQFERYRKGRSPRPRAW